MCMIRYSWCHRAEPVLYPSHLCHLLTLVGGLVLILYCTCYEMCVQEYGILNLCSFLLYAVCGQIKSSEKGHCISTKPWWIWTIPSVHCCLVSAGTCSSFENVICWNLMKVPVTSKSFILLGYLLLLCGVCTKFFEGSVCFVFPGYCCREV